MLKELKDISFNKELLDTGLFDKIPDTFFRRYRYVLKENHKYMIIASEKEIYYWKIIKTEDHVKFSEVFEDSSNDLKKKLAFHMDILDV